MGVPEGMTDLSTSRNLDFLPSFTAIRYESIDGVTGARPPGGGPGGLVNVKYGIALNHEEREGIFICASCHLRASSRTPEFRERDGWTVFPTPFRAPLRTVVASV